MKLNEIKNLILLLGKLHQNIDEKYINDDFNESMGILFKTLRKIEKEFEE